MANGKINLINTGISIVDESWGGFYRGGTYVLIGPRKSGRTTIGLQFAMAGIQQKEVCLYFTSMRPKDLMILAASVDFDLQTHMDNGELIVVKVTPPLDVYESGNPDNYLVEYLNDIVNVVEQYQPARLVFDELTYFVGFENIGLLQQAFLRTIEAIEDKNVTSLYVLGEPATPFAQNIVDNIVQYTTAIIYLQKVEGGRVQGGKATITPNIGHTEGQFTTDFTFEPYKGVVFTVDKKPQTEIFDPGQANSYPAMGMPSSGGYPSTPQPSVSNVGFQPGGGSPPPRYRALSEIEVVHAPMTHTNQYSKEEFNLILNNQVALYKSTGQAFTLIVFKLDPQAEAAGIISTNQLNNAIRLSLTLKEKVCIDGFTTIVLVGKSDEKALSVLTAKIKANLQSNDPSYLPRVLSMVYAFTYVSNATTENADGILREVL
jgi:circadian clock protein KaiC